MKILTHEGLQYFYNQIAAKFSTKEQTAEAIEEAVGNAGVGTVTSVNGKTGVVQLSASDVGALPASTQIPSIAGLATETYVDNKVASMVDSAPETLNTLNELAAALGDDPNFATTVATEIGGKVNKSGDTMTGKLYISATNGAIGQSVDNSNFRIDGGTTYNKGAFLSLFGKDYSNAGYFQLVACDGTNRKDLLGKPSGVLQWDGFDILTTKSPVTIAQGGTGATTAEGALTNLGALPLSGGTLTGALSLPGNLYAEGDTLDATQHAINMNNSNIVGVNGIYMNDAADGITEGVHFYRSATTYDSLWAASGKLYFTPNRPLSGAGTAYTVYHTGNKPTEIVSGTSTLTTGIAATPILYLKKNGYSHWAIERAGDTDNRLIWHYYDPTTGNWTGNAFIIDSNNWVDYALPRTPAQIEFMPGTSANHGGYIDFHFNSSSADYTSRIIESASGELTMNNYCKLFNSGRQMQLTGSTSDDTAYARFIASTSSGSVALQASTNWGVYDITGSRWLIHVNKSDDSSNVNIAGWASIGSSTQPVYFNNKGRPVACTAVAITNGGTGATSEVAAANNLKVQSLGHGTDIPANANLNTYTTVGNYRCSSTNTAATIANCPVANAFTLQVYAATGTSTSAPTTAGWAYFIQKFTILSGAQYYRTITFSNSTTASFGDWVKIYDTNNKPTASEIGAMPAYPGSIEFATSSSANNGGFIDFHFNGSTADYTSRIIEEASGVLQINGATFSNGTITATKIVGAVYA